MSSRLAAPLIASTVFYISLFRAPLWFARSKSATVVTNEAALAEKATALELEGKWQDALEPRLTLAKAFPSNHIYAGQLAEIYHGLNRPADEAAAWESFVASSPTPSEACPQIGLAYRTANNITKAIDAFNRCLDFDRADSEAMYYAGNAAEWSNHWDRARELYDAALVREPENVDIMLGQARVKLHAGDYAAALAEAERVLSAKPRYADAMVAAGQASQGLGKSDQAQGYFIRALAAAPDRADVRAAVERFGRRR